MVSYEETLACLSQASMPREAFEELSDLEYSTLARMAQAQGVETVARMFAPLSAAERHASLHAYVQHELHIASERIQTMESAQRQQHSQAAGTRSRATPLKVDVGKYAGRENESLLRWLVEVDQAIRARCIDDEAMKVAFVMSNLAGRAKTWAFGRRLGVELCFSSYAELKKDLKQTFEPPKSEFRARAEFLDLKQGKRDIHAYSNYARYLVSCIVSDPVDDSTQVVCFLKGLTDGPVKTHLFREYPVTLEDAIALALQEDFSLQQAYVHSSTYRPPRSREMHERDGTEPMDLSAADVRASRETRTCHRCGKAGHLQYQCTAPQDMRRPRAAQSQRGLRRDGRFGRQGQAASRVRFDERRPKRDERPKNAKSQ